MLIAAEAFDLVNDERFRSLEARMVHAQELIDALPPEQRLRLPMRPGNRSLNLSNAVAVVAYEAWRQQGFDGGA